ncbi:serine hydrolase [Chamaesiphon minutus]|uniref:Beta-lactamase n=1 Tax=Chamaesiphon minutus (strain ATCC 27169 / PCC 6605) TaxID=1173020 RepID=K9UQB0_CHAP6|nr:serine hydrolase [Chamaesiphon minutus]AFY96990.1 beta-lactamase class A [Chamaesiphon minutus PCC 6605]
MIKRRNLILGAGSSILAIAVANIVSTLTASAQKNELRDSPKERLAPVGFVLTHLLGRETRPKCVAPDHGSESRQQLRQRIEQIARTAQGRVGVTATVLETGQSVTLDGAQRFPMQSVYKFPIAMAVLDRVDRGKLTLDRRVRIESSDIAPVSATLDRKSQGKEFTLAVATRNHKSSNPQSSQNRTQIKCNYPVVPTRINCN